MEIKEFREWKQKAKSIRQHFDKQNYFSNAANPLKADSNTAASSTIRNEVINNVSN